MKGCESNSKSGILNSWTQSNWSRSDYVCDTTCSVNYFWSSCVMTCFVTGTLKSYSMNNSCNLIWMTLNVILTLYNCVNESENLYCEND